jgi:UDP-galactopyranose mutase
MPRDGYTAMFERMLDRPSIEVRTGVDFSALRETLDCPLVVYTGPVDEYFGHCYGRLPYRSLRFEFEHHAADLVQPVGTINEPDEAVPWTRTTEFKHLTGQRGPVTTVVRELPMADGDPYYPIPRPANEALYQRYRALADTQPDVTFVGRLATYRYYNMDQVVAQALATWKRLRTRSREPGASTAAA